MRNIPNKVYTKGNAKGSLSQRGCPWLSFMVASLYHETYNGATFNCKEKRAKRGAGYYDLLMLPLAAGNTDVTNVQN